MKIFGFNITRNNRSGKSHALTEEERQRGRATQMYNRTLKQLNERLKRKEQLEQIRALKELVEEEDEDFVEEDTGVNEDQLLLTILNKFLHGKEGLGSSVTKQEGNDLNNKIDLTSAEVEQTVKAFPKHYLGVAKKLPDKLLKARITAEMSQLSETSVSAIVEAIKN